MTQAQRIRELVLKLCEDNPEKKFDSTDIFSLCYEALGNGSSQIHSETVKLVKEGKLKRHLAENRRYYYCKA